MISSIEYLAHKTYAPGFIHRDYARDLPVQHSPSNQKARRILLLTLPFLSLYPPVGRSMGIGLSATRCICCLTEATKAMWEKNLKSCAKEMGRTSLAVVSLSAAVFHFQLGLLVAGSIDLLEHIFAILQDLQGFERDKILEDLIQLIGSSLFLAILCTGSMELIFISLVFQGILQIYQAASEYKKGQLPESIAKLAMGTIRFHQAHRYFHWIQERNTLRSLEKIAKIIQKIQEGRNASHLIDAPTYSEEDETILVDGKGEAFRFGAHVHGKGKQTVKEMNLEWRTCQKDGKAIRELDFKVTHVARAHLQRVIKELKSFSKEELNHFLFLFQSHAKSIQIKKVPFQLTGQTASSISSAYKITLEGLGSLFIGASPLCPTTYDQVRIELEEGKTLFELHELLSFFQLDDALRNSSLEEIERLKLGHLFRIFYPKEATLLERDAQFFQLSLQGLKEKMIETAPLMDQLIKDYMPRMTRYEILPGRMRYGIEGLGKEAESLGAKALIATLTGAKGEAGLERLASILKMGMLSSEMRYKHGLAISGMSSETDFFTGGADSVFTQLLPEKAFRDEMELNQLAWKGKIRILFSLDALNTGSYQYPCDLFGWRSLHAKDESFQPYLQRPNLFEFIKEEQLHFHSKNEVMLKERIPPRFIQGIIVPDEQTKAEVLLYLERKGLVDLENRTILNIPIEKFIHAGTALSNAFLPNC